MQEGRDHLPRALRGQMGGGRVTFYIGIDYGLTINVGLLNVQQILFGYQAGDLLSNQDHGT